MDNKRNSKLSDLTHYWSLIWHIEYTKSIKAIMDLDCSPEIHWFFYYRNTCRSLGHFKVRGIFFLFHTFQCTISQNLKKEAKHFECMSHSYHWKNSFITILKQVKQWLPWIAHWIHYKGGRRHKILLHWHACLEIISTALWTSAEVTKLYYFYVFFKKTNSPQSTANSNQ
jgi:hypothetical protein